MMKAPESTAGKIAAGTGIAAAGALTGAALSRLTRAKAADGSVVQRIPDMTGAIAGTLLASTAGAITSVLETRGDEEEKSYGEIGGIAAAVGIGGLTAAMLFGLARTYLAPPALSAPASGPVTLPVLSSDSGKTLAAKVGDTIQIQLPSTLVAGGTSPWTWTVPAGAPLQKAQPVPAAGGIEVDAFKLTGPGTAQIIASMADGTSFNLNVVAS